MESVVNLCPRFLIDQLVGKKNMDLEQVVCSICEVDDTYMNTEDWKELFAKIGYTGDSYWTITE